uniref:Uncharacterized protein n=1 Tax=Sphaerodactylus townsendi TaxID=933632 RepID=A0ACB8F7X6_9SAUR
MSQVEAVVCFRPEGDRMMSPQHFPRALERRPRPSPSKNADLAAFSPQPCLTPNLNAGRLHLLRKGLTPEARWSQLGMYSSTGSLIHRVAEMSCLGNGSCPSSGRVTAPCTPLRSKPSHSLGSPGSRSPLVAPVPGGQSSVVTFRFIEKASVKTLNGLPLAEPKREKGLSRSLELGEALACGPSKQGNGCPTLPKQLCSPQHKAVTSPAPATHVVKEEARSKIDSSTTAPAGKQAALALGSKVQEHLSHKLKLETSASDPLLTGSKFLASAQSSSLSLGHGSLLRPLAAHCLSSSLTNGMSSPARDLSVLWRGPQSEESQGGPWAYSRECSAHAQRIAKAKWEFFYGSLDPPGTGFPVFGDAIGS